MNYRKFLATVLFSHALLLVPQQGYALDKSLPLKPSKPLQSKQEEQLLVLLKRLKQLSVEERKEFFKTSNLKAAQQLQILQLLSLLPKASEEKTVVSEAANPTVTAQQACDKGSSLSCNKLGIIYYQDGLYTKAEPLLQRALQLDEKTLHPEHSDVASSLNNLAALYEAQGKYDEAEPLYKRSLKIVQKTLGKDHSFVAISLNNLARLYLSEGKLEQAKALYERSLAIKEKTLGKDNPDLAESLHNLANVYVSQGKHEQAEPLYQRSLAIREKSLGKDHLDVAESLENLAQLYYSQGKYDKAEPLFQRSLAMREKTLGKDHPDVASSLNGLAWLYIAQGKYEKAQLLLQKSLHATNQTLERDLWGASEKKRQSYLLREELNGDNYLSFYSLANLPEEAFSFSMARKGLSLRISSEVSALTKPSSRAGLQKQKQDFNALRSQLSALLFSGKADKQKIDDLEEKSSFLESQLTESLTQFKQNKTTVLPVEVIKKLKSDQVLIDFLVFSEKDFKTAKNKAEQLIALVVDKKQGTKLIKLSELAPISAAIKNYRATITPDKDNSFAEQPALTQAAQNLYQKLWQPLTPFLQNKKIAYLISDGPLHLLPFKALQDKDGKYVGESLQLINLSSARDLVLPPLAGKAGSSAIFADPDYGGKAGLNNSYAAELKNIHFSPLEGALKEGQLIEKLFAKKQPPLPVKLFAQKQATKFATATLSAPKIVHFATQCFFLADKKIDDKVLNSGLLIGKVENPLTRSGLALAGANLAVKDKNLKEGIDGILTALEVLNLDLDGTDLVTLSGCDSDNGDIKMGKGISNLNRAFQAAGAKTILSTLWTVDEVARTEFMQKFYQRFLNGQSAQQALQETQNEFSHDEKYSHPFYWAGFVVQGKE